MIIFFKVALWIIVVQAALLFVVFALVGQYSEIQNCLLRLAVGVGFLLIVAVLENIERKMK